MIDPHQITNENIFDVDYASTERKTYLAALHKDPSLPAELMAACTYLGTGLGHLALKSALVTIRRFFHNVVKAKGVK